VLDEPFKNLSTEYRDAVCRLLEELSKKLNIQFLIVTHIPDFEVGKVIRL